MFTTRTGPTTVLTSSNWTGSSRILTNLTRRSLRMTFHGALPIAGISGTGEPPQTPVVPRVLVVPTVEEREPGGARNTPTEASAPASGGSQDAPLEANAPAPKRSAGVEKIELAIDKLPNHELIKPIPVLIESLGDKVFIAEVPGLEISITGNSMGGVLLQLKEHIANIYEGHRASNNLKQESARQLKLLETYIGKTRRNWF